MAGIVDISFESDVSKSLTDLEKLRKKLEEIDKLRSGKKGTDTSKIDEVKKLAKEEEKIAKDKLNAQKLLDKQELSNKSLPFDSVIEQKMGSNYFKKVFQFLCYFLFIFPIIVNTSLCHSQEYRLKESIQLFKDWEESELRNAFKITFSYDDQGRRTGLKNYRWETDEWIFFMGVSYNYDDDGKLLECNVTNFDELSVPVWLIQNYRVIYSYDSNGYLEKIRKIPDNSSSSSDDYSSTFYMQFDELGNLINLNLGNITYKYKSNGKYVNVESIFFSNYGVQKHNWLYISYINRL